MHSVVFHKCCRMFVLEEKQIIGNLWQALAKQLAFYP